MAKQKSAKSKAKPSVKKMATMMKKKKKKKQPEKMKVESYEESLARICKEMEWNTEKYSKIEIGRELYKASRRKQLQDDGFVFMPSDELFVNLYLKFQSVDRPLEFCPIDEVDVYANHPRTLTEQYIQNGGVWHFFTNTRPNENPEIQGVWKFGKMKDIFDNGVKVGVRQELEFYEEGGHNGNGSFKMFEYQLHPATHTSLFSCELFDCRGN